MVKMGQSGGGINLKTSLNEYIIVFEITASTPNWTHIVNKTFVANELRPRLSLKFKLQNESRLRPEIDPNGMAKL